MLLLAGGASAQLAPNQTHGFGNGRLLEFTYQQNFDCVDAPAMDLDSNGVAAPCAGTNVLGGQRPESGRRDVLPRRRSPRASSAVTISARC
ncbi:MAG: hypothetical protein WA900_15225 [Casimicrobiaceae bacterium]